MSFFALIATVGVYGLVALIVRMDDAGYKLIKENKNSFTKNLGVGLVKALPIVIKVLGVVGTVALVLVAGGIFRHNIHEVHHFFENIPTIVSDAVIGLVVGFVALALMLLFNKARGKAANA